jgi:hypothetical protein
MKTEYKIAIAAVIWCLLSTVISILSGMANKNEVGREDLDILVKSYNSRLDSMSSINQERILQLEKMIDSAKVESIKAVAKFEEGKKDIDKRIRDFNEILSYKKNDYSDSTLNAIVRRLSD